MRRRAIQILATQTSGQPSKLYRVLFVDKDYCPSGFIWPVAPPHVLALFVFLSRLIHHTYLFALCRPFNFLALHQKTNLSFWVTLRRVSARHLAIQQEGDSWGTAHCVRL